MQYLAKYKCLITAGKMVLYMHEMKNARIIAVIIELNKGLWPLPLGFCSADEIFYSHS
jgi:hypothetical protein